MSRNDRNEKKVWGYQEVLKSSEDQAGNDHCHQNQQEKEKKDVASTTLIPRSCCLATIESCLVGSLAGEKKMSDNLVICRLRCRVCVPGMMLVEILSLGPLGQLTNPIGPFQGRRSPRRTRFTKERHVSESSINPAPSLNGVNVLVKTYRRRAVLMARVRVLWCMGAGHLSTTLVSNPPIKHKKDDQATAQDLPASRQ